MGRAIGVALSVLVAADANGHWAELEMAVPLQYLARHPGMAWETIDETGAVHVKSRVDIADDAA